MKKAFLGYNIKFCDSYELHEESLPSLSVQFISLPRDEVITIKHPVLSSFRASKYSKQRPEYQLDFRTDNFYMFLRENNKYSYYIYFTIDKKTKDLLDDLIFILKLLNIDTDKTKDGQGVRIESQKGLQVIKLDRLGNYMNGFEQRIDIDKSQVKNLLSSSFTKIKDGYLSIKD